MAYGTKASPLDNVMMQQCRLPACAWRALLCLYNAEQSHGCEWMLAQAQDFLHLPCPPLSACGGIHSHKYISASVEVFLLHHRICPDASRTCATRLCHCLCPYASAYSFPWHPVFHERCGTQFGGVQDRQCMIAASQNSCLA